MPPVPVRIDDPIKPTKPLGATPQTTAEQQQQPLSPTNSQATTSQNISPAYPPARPGAVASAPAPTPYVPQPQPSPSRTQPLPTAQNVPAPPQPGAVPVPPSQQMPVTTLPPPPKAGESLQQQQQQQQPTLPAQMSIPSPQQNYAPTYSTTTAPMGYIPPTATTTQQPQGRTTLNLGPVPVSAPHPPGYHQNTAAQELTPAQRSSLDEQERKESLLGALGGDSAGEAAGSMWNTVKGWASTAGEKLAETEESVWRKINQR